MTDQTTLGKPTARIGAKTDYGYTRPVVMRQGQSTGTAVRYAHIKATGLPGWELYFAAKPNCPAAWTCFARDDTVLTMFCDEHGITLPLTGKLAVSWRVEWRKIGQINTISKIEAIEALPEDKPVTDTVADKTTLNEAFPRDADDEPKPQHWIDDKTLRGAFWAKLTPWIKWSGWEGKADKFANEKIGSIHDWDDGQPAAEERLIKEAIYYRWTKTGRVIGKDDFQAATGYPTLRGALTQGSLSDNELRSLIDTHLATPAETGAHAALPDAMQQPASTPPQTAKSKGQVSTIASTTQNAPAGKSVPQTGQSTAPSTNQRPALKLVEQVASIRTLTGIPIADIHSRLDTTYPSAAYKDIKLAGGKKGTDIGSDFVRNRFEDVFGGHGIGWKFDALPGLGDVRWEQLDVDGGLKYQVTIIMHTFKYRVVMPDGSLEWIELSPMSDVGTNVKASYAHRSAFTALLKQVLRSLGGMDHLKKAA